MCDQLVRARTFEVADRKVIDYSVLAGDFLC